MVRFILSVMLVLIGMGAYAHELTPTYPQLRSAYVDGVSVTTMLLFNRREDVSYYEIDVYDADWNPVAFATSSKILQVDYLDRVFFDIYIRDRDKDKATYICTMSKLLKDGRGSAVSSRICSKLK